MSDKAAVRTGLGGGNEMPETKKSGLATERRETVDSSHECEHYERLSSVIPSR